MKKLGAILLFMALSTVLLIKPSAYVAAQTSGPVATITSAPTQVRPGERVTLSWTSQGATALSIDQSVGSVDAPAGSTVVTPYKTLTYTLTAIDSQNRTSKSTATVTVSNEPVFELRLPPLKVFTPDQLSFGGRSFTFNIDTGQFTPVTQDGYTVETVTEGKDQLTSYHILVYGFKKGGSNLAQIPTRLNQAIASLANEISAKAFAPPPATNIWILLQQKPKYSYRLTFKQPVVQATVDSLADYLSQNGNPNNDLAYLGTDQCGESISGSNVCLKTKVSLFEPTLTSAPFYPQTLLQSIQAHVSPQGQLSIQGNVAANQLLTGFTIDGNAVAVGGQVAIGGSNVTPIPNYLTGSKLNWATVGAKLNDQYAKATTQGTNVDPGSATYSSTLWNLNATGSQPNLPTMSSFSDVPEGKLWKWRNLVGDLTFDTTAADKSITFTGAGTIVVNGNVTFNGPIDCSQNAPTRFGLIATGSITFRSPIVQCGAYLALGSLTGSSGTITFAGDVTTDTVGNAAIIVGKGDILLPRVVIGKKFSLKYDSTFANQPTILFKDVLSALSGQ